MCEILQCICAKYQFGIFRAFAFDVDLRKHKKWTSKFFFRLFKIKCWIKYEKESEEIRGRQRHHHVRVRRDHRAPRGLRSVSGPGISARLRIRDPGRLGHAPPGIRAREARLGVPLCPGPSLQRRRKRYGELDGYGTVHGGWTHMRRRELHVRLHVHSQWGRSKKHRVAGRGV